MTTTCILKFLGHVIQQTISRFISISLDPCMCENAIIKFLYTNVIFASQRSGDGPSHAICKK